MLLKYANPIFDLHRTPYTFFRSVSSCLTVLSPYRQSLQYAIRQFCEVEVAPYSRLMDNAQRLKPQLLNSLFESGYMGIEVDDDFGGAGMEFFDTILIVEEVAKADASVAVVVDIHVGGCVSECSKSCPTTEYSCYSSIDQIWIS